MERSRVANLIGVSGKIGSGKDLTGTIIQMLTDKQLQRLPREKVAEYVLAGDVWDSPSFYIKKYADKLKEVVCLLTGCKRPQLEDINFKNSEIGPDWNCWVIEHQEPGMNSPLLFLSEAEAQKMDSMLCMSRVTYRRMTYRMLLQLLGTEAGREIVHPQLWVNALFADYKPTNLVKGIAEKPFHDRRVFRIPEGHGEHSGKFIDNRRFEYESETPIYPNWVITDMRFPNELEAVKVRGGISIRVFRGWEPDKVEHESETALDNAKFDYMVDNNGDIADLVEKIQLILIKENIIK